jgi:outer membrane protein assembly factor BamB
VIAVFVAIAVVVAAVMVVARTGGPPATAATAPSRRLAVKSTGVIPASWARTLPDAPSSMLRDHRRVVVIGSEWVSAIGVGDGRVRWQTPVQQVNPQGALHGDLLLVSTASSFWMMDRTTGETHWHVNTPETPGPVALVGPPGTPAIAIVSTEEGGLAGLDSRTGTARWALRYPGQIQGVPAVDDQSGAVATVWRVGDGIQLRVLDGATGAIRWERQLARMAGSPLVTVGPGGHRMVVVGAGSGDYDGRVRAFSLDDGTSRWEAPVAASFGPDLELLADGGDLYAVDQLTNVTRLDLASGERRWSTDAGGVTVIARPVRSGSAILIETVAGKVVALDRTTGAIRTRRQANGIPIGLVAADGLVVVAEEGVPDRQLQAFPAAAMAGSARKRR